MVTAFLARKRLMTMTMMMIMMTKCTHKRARREGRTKLKSCLSFAVDGWDGPLVPDNCFSNPKVPINEPNHLTHTST